MRRRNRRGRGASAFLVFLALLAAATLRGGDPVPITVQLDWKPGMQFAGLLLAQERGWYREAGLDVTIRANDFKRPYINVVAESDHTVGTSEARSLVGAWTLGRPIRAVATMFQASPVVLISLKARGIRTADDLEGKTVGIHRFEDLDMLRLAFKKMFVPREVGFDFKELLAGEVDAAPGYVMDEPLRLAQSGTEVNVLSVADNGWIDYSQVLFVSDAFLEKNPAALERFLTATFRGWRAVLAEPEAAVAIVDKQAPADLNAASLRESLRRIAPLLTRESPHLGLMRAETWKRIIDVTPTYDRAPRQATVEGLVDFRFLPTLEKD